MAMDFAMLPPEINSGRMYAGPGSGPMLAAAAAWSGLAADLESAASSYQSVISGLTGGAWLGPAAGAGGHADAPPVGVDEDCRVAGRAARHPGPGHRGGL